MEKARSVVRLFRCLVRKKNLRFQVDEIQIDLARQGLEHQQALQEYETQFVEQFQADVSSALVGIIWMSHVSNVLLVVQAGRSLSSAWRR